MFGGRAVGGRRSAVGVSNDGERWSSPRKHVGIASSEGFWL